jgi:Protein of unknown function (DUF3800)
VNAPCTIPDGHYESLSRLIEILAPGESDLVAFLECYFDESGSHAGSPVLCVAGYLFERERCKAFDLGCKEVLEQYRLPYFRMSACAHNQRPFDHLSRDECIDAEKAMIRLVNDHALLGLAVAVNEHDYNIWFPQPNPVGSSYSFCCWQILAGIQSWIWRNNFEGNVSFFYETGHASGPEANSLMTRIFNNPALRERYRYLSHTFADKQALRPLQAADMLAWHWGTQMKRWLKNDPRMRADFRALSGKPQHELFIANRKTVAPVMAYHRHLQGAPIDNGVTGYFGGRWFWCSFDGEDHFSL